MDWVTRILEGIGLLWLIYHGIGATWRAMGW